MSGAGELAEEQRHLDATCAAYDAILRALAIVHADPLPDGLAASQELRHAAAGEAVTAWAAGRR